MSLFNKIRQQLRRIKPAHRYAVVATILIMIGAASIFNNVNASESDFSWQAESGQVNGKATLANDGGASQGSYVAFGKEEPAPTAGSGTASFAYSTIAQDTEGMPHSKAIADVNGDGKLDVVVATHGGRGGNSGIFWYENPTWKEYRIANGSFSTDVEAKDIDGDGKVDVATTDFSNRNSKKVVWFKQPANPKTTWGSSNIIGEAEGHDVSIAQLDGKSYAEVIVRGSNSFSATGGGDSIIIFSSTGGNWTQKKITTEKGEGLEVGDIDSDGKIDIVATARWYKNPGTVNGNWQEKIARTDYISRYSMHTKVNVGDVNGDGKLDIALTVAEPGNSPALGNLYKPVANAPVVWLEQPADPGSSNWQLHEVAKLSDETHAIVIADFDGDGDGDIAAGEMEQSDKDRVIVAINKDGKGNSWETITIGTAGTHNLQAGDLNGDGLPDLIGANHGWDLKLEKKSTPVQLWTTSLSSSNQNNGGSSGGKIGLTKWRRTIAGETDALRNIFAVHGDFDGDGDQDIASGNTWLKNNGSSWAKTKISNNFNVALAFDADKDGDIDLLGTDQSSLDSNKAVTRTLAWARNDGGSFTYFNNVGQSGALKGDFLQGAAYLAKEHQVALSWHGGNSDVQMLSIPSNPANTKWTVSNITGVSENEEITAIDLDKDGDTDLVLGTSWLENQGGNWKSNLQHKTNKNADRNGVADINGDGKLDIMIGFEGINAEEYYAWYSPGANIRALWDLGGNGLAVGPMSLSLADMDNDGDIDMVLGEHSNGNSASFPTNDRSIWIYENTDGKGNFKRTLVYKGDEHHDGAELFDVDNDGDLDILSIGWTHRRVHVYVNEN